MGGITEAPLYMINIANPPWSKATNITSIEIGIKGGQSLIYGSMLGYGDTSGTLTPLPHTLKPGDSATHWVEFEQLQKDLHRQNYSDTARLTLKVKDALGKYHKKRVNIHLS